MRVREEILGGLPKRLKSLMLDGEKDYRFAKRMGINPTTMSLFLSGKRLPQTKSILKICDNAGVNMEWLVKGAGDKYPVYNLDELKRTSGLEEPSIIIDGPEDEPARRIGTNAVRKLTGRDFATLAASYIIDSDLPKHDRERLADLVRQAMAEPELLHLLLDAADLHRFRQKK